MDSSIISIQNLHFSYRKKKVFDDLSIHFKRGYIYGLLGRNGTGKSTLLNNIAGLLFPQSGTVKALGFVPGNRQPAFLQDVFLVPEEFYLPDISVQKFLKYNAPFYPLFNQYEFDDYLKLLEIPLDCTLDSLSYGQKKKVLISFGLATNVSLLLMDEPTNGLDVIGKSQVRKIIAGSFNENKCIIISSHQVKDLENLIDRVTIIDEGKIVLDESTMNIAGKLSFKITFDSAELKWAIYSEPMLRGNAIVAVNADGEENRIDLELLYKATVANPKIIYSIFNA
jgi:ABC-2 type transport system ATP-binding protein